MISMDPATYWRLRFLQAEDEKATQYAQLLDARVRIELFKAQRDAQAAASVYREALRAAGEAYQLDVSAPFGWNDDQTALVPVTQD